VISRREVIGVISKVKETTMSAGPSSVSGSGDITPVQQANSDAETFATQLAIENTRHNMKMSAANAQYDATTKQKT
jgi:hypothetical protein